MKGFIYNRLVGRVGVVYPCAILCATVIPLPVEACGVDGLGNKGRGRKGSDTESASYTTFLHLGSVGATCAHLFI